MMESVLNIFNIQTINNGASTGQNWIDTSGAKIDSFSPVDGKLIASVKSATTTDYNLIIETAQTAFLEWRKIPSPKRGEIVRQLAEKIRFYKEPLGKLVSYEMGKSLQEGLGEVQEMIDICDFAVGLSANFMACTMHSERQHIRMYEQYHPLGIVGIIPRLIFLLRCGIGTQHWHGLW
jgi:aldehyde dehydrogenase (NAD+)